MAKKTKMSVVSIFDGKQDATDVFVSLIAEKMREDAQDFLVEKGTVCYDKNKVQATNSLASGLCE